MSAEKSKNRRLAVQVQQDRAPKNSPWFADVIRGCVCTVSGSVESYYDDTTVDFVTAPLTESQLTMMWNDLQAAIKKTPHLHKTLIVTAQGRLGRDDYQLLYHYDPDEPIDTFLASLEDLSYEFDIGGE